MTAAAAQSVLTFCPEQVAQHPGNLRDATRDIDALAASRCSAGGWNAYSAQAAAALIAAAQQDYQRRRQSGRPTSNAGCAVRDGACSAAEGGWECSRCVALT